MAPPVGHSPCRSPRPGHGRKSSAANSGRSSDATAILAGNVQNSRQISAKKGIVGKNMGL